MTQHQKALNALTREKKNNNNFQLFMNSEKLAKACQLINELTIISHSQ